jgi:hypothetical protein
MDEDRDKLARLYPGMAERVGQLERELEDANRKLVLFEAEKKQWELEKVSQQTIIQNAVARANEISNGYLEEIRRLKEENRKLKGGS